MEVSKKGKIDIYRLEALLDQWEGITYLDTESEDCSFIHRKKGVELNHIKTSIKEDYRIQKCILAGKNTNFNQFKQRGTDMTNLSMDSELRLGTPEKGGPPPVNSLWGTPT